MTLRQTQLSVNLSRTNYFVISWLNYFQVFHFIRKTWYSDFSCPALEESKCQIIENISLFLLGKSLVFKQLSMLGRGVSMCSMWATLLQPYALLHMLSLAVPVTEWWSLCGFQREAEMEWKCHAICFGALWGFSEERSDCPLQSTAPYSLVLRETRHLRYSCHEHSFVFMPSVPRQLDCWRPDGTLRDTAVDQEHFTSPIVQSEQNQALPTKAQYGWGHSRGLPFVCN